MTCFMFVLVYVCMYTHTGSKMASRIHVFYDDVVYSRNVFFGPDCDMTFGIHAMYANSDELATFVQQLIQYVYDTHGDVLTDIEQENNNYLFTFFYTEDNKVFIVKHKSQETLTRERIETHFKNDHVVEVSEQDIDGIIRRQPDNWQCIVRIIDKREYPEYVLFNNVVIVSPKTPTVDQVSDVLGVTSL